MTHASRTLTCATGALLMVTCTYKHNKIEMQCGNGSATKRTYVLHNLPMYAGAFTSVMAFLSKYYSIGDTMIFLLIFGLFLFEYLSLLFNFNFIYNLFIIISTRVTLIIVYRLRTVSCIAILFYDEMK
jgi:hypothetical protein